MCFYYLLLFSLFTRLQRRPCFAQDALLLFLPLLEYALIAVKMFINVINAEPSITMKKILSFATLADIANMQNLIIPSSVVNVAPSILSKWKKIEKKQFSILICCLKKLIDLINNFSRTNQYWKYVCAA